MVNRYFIPKSMLFEQMEPANVWTIQHYCGYPNVDVYVDFLDNTGILHKIIPFDVKYISDTICEIHFTEPFSGKAKLVG